MATMTSRLLVSLVDGVTAPARRAAQGLNAIPNAARRANGQMTGFSQRIDAAIARNNRALEAARGRMLDAVAGAYALRGAMTSTAGAAMALEDKMADIAKVSGMSTEELKGFEGVLRNMARKEIPLAVEELAELAAAASQSGIANADLEEFTRMVAKSAVAWEVSGGEAGEALAKIKTALGLTIEETRNYADAINYLSDSTASSAPDLIEFSRRVAADGKVAGFANEEVLALGAAMISAGSSADVAATSLRNVGRMLGRGDFGAKKSQLQAFKQLGLDAEKVAKAMQVDASGTLLEVLAAIREAPAHMQAALASGIFGDEARALTPLLGELDKTRETITAIGNEMNYLGSVQDEFAKRATTGRYALQMFQSQLRDVGIAVGQSLLPAMKEALSVIGPILIKLGDWAQANPKLLATITAVIGGVVGLRIAMTALSYIGLMGKGGVLGALSVGARMLGGTVGYLWGAAKASVALQVALAGMSGGKVGVLAKIAIGARGMLMAIPGVAGLAKAIGLIGVAVKAVGAAMLANPIALAVAAIAGTAYLIYRNWDAVEPYFTRLWEGIKGIFRGFYDWIAGIFTLDFERSVNGLKAIFTSWDDIGKAMFDAGAALITSLLDGLKSAFSSVTAWVSDAAGKIVSPFQSAKSAISRGWSKLTGGDEIDGARAKGGPISAGGTYLVGEKGPEVITPSRSGYVHPNGSTPAAGAQVTLNAPITISGATGDVKALAREVARELEQVTRRLMSGTFSDIGVARSGA